jgi:hypothetical protein
MVYPSFRVRPMFPLKATYSCPLLPHADGFPVLRVLPADLTSSRSSAPSLLGQVRLPVSRFRDFPSSV